MSRGKGFHTATNVLTCAVSNSTVWVVQYSTVLTALNHLSPTRSANYLVVPTLAGKSLRLCCDTLQKHIRSDKKTSSRKYYYYPGAQVTVTFSYSACQSRVQIKMKQMQETTSRRDGVSHKATQTNLDGRDVDQPKAKLQ